MVAGLFGLLLGRGLIPYTGPVEFIESEDTERPFSDYFEAEIRPHVAVFEEKRIAALRRYRRRSWVALPCFIGLAVLALVLSSAASSEIALMLSSASAPEIALVGCFVAGAGVFYWWRRPVMRYRAAVKTEVFPLVFRFFGEAFDYDHRCPRTVRTLKASRLIPSYDNEYTEDLVTGRWCDVDLELFEAKLTEERGSGKNRRTVTVFRGVFITFEAHKNFTGQTVIRRDWGTLGNWLSFMPARLETVRLEDPKFEDLFEVYSTDQIEARYLLTPSFMERLIQLGNLFDGKIQASFYDNKLLLMIESSRNRFETSSIFEPATFTDDINGILQEMNLIFQIIDVLKLHERTGL